MRTHEDHLKDLPAYDVEASLSAQIRARAHAALATATGREARPSPTNHWFYRVVEPTALIGLGVAQLFWAVHDTLALFP